MTKNGNLEVPISTPGQIYVEKEKKIQNIEKPYSFYVIRASGVQHTLVSLCYLLKIDVLLV